MSDRPERLYLVLDDDQARHDGYTQILGDVVDPKTGIKRAFTADEAIAHLRDYRFHTAFLDHDLGEFGFHSNPGCGMDVVDFICSMRPEDRPKMVWIHSWNDSASREMEKRLVKETRGLAVRRQPYRAPKAR